MLSIVEIAGQCYNTTPSGLEAQRNCLRDRGRERGRERESWPCVFRTFTEVSEHWIGHKDYLYLISIPVRYEKLSFIFSYRNIPVIFHFLLWFTSTLGFAIRILFFRLSLTRWILIPWVIARRMRNNAQNKLIFQEQCVCVFFFSRKTCILSFAIETTKCHKLERLNLANAYDDDGGDFFFYSLPMLYTPEYIDFLASLKFQLLS